MSRAFSYQRDIPVDQIEFTRHVSYVNNLPHVITFRPVNVNGTFAQIASRLQNLMLTTIDREVRAHNPFWTTNDVLTRVNGILSVLNTITGSAHSRYLESNRTLREQRRQQGLPPSPRPREGRLMEELSLMSFTESDVVLDLIQTIAQSNVTIEINDLEWQFTIDPTSFIQGGSVKVKPPHWVPQIKFRATWQGHVDDKGPINCAAYAINYLMYGTQKRYDKRVKQSEIDARALQTELGWSETTSLQELADFVEKYPKYRITAFLPNATENPATFAGAEFEYEENNLEYLIYLVYDAIQNHYGATKSPAEIIRKIHNCPDWAWCHLCCVPVYRQNEHTCEGSSFVPRKRQRPCECGQYGKHTCYELTCRFCSSVYKKDTFSHRCILYKLPRGEEKNLFVDNEEILPNGKSPALFVYDLESRVHIVPTYNPLIVGFETDEDGTYKDENVAVYDYHVQEHRANMVVFQNVFSNEEPIVYFGDDCLQRFLMYMLNYNHGNNICIAHNAAGYDTRLIFSAATKLTKTKMSPIMRGAKFMQLKVGDRLVFRDSLLHVKGSLRNLAKDFCAGTTLRKGHFPHLFNSIENYEYVGPIPDKKYFDLSFITKDEKDRDEFNTWYHSWDGRTDWSFRKELEDYCVDDVKILAKIVKGYHDVCISHTKMTPWLNATAPSFVHEVFVTLLSQQLELPDPKEDKNLYSAQVQELADTKFWAVLKPNEYWFARKALRGGRTEIKKMYHNVTEEDRLAGKNITYQDVNSLYPFQQVEHDFPTGRPTIYVWDLPYFPCVKHQNNQEAKCYCSLTNKGDRFLKIENMLCQPQWTAEQILADESFFGIVCATLIPPKDLYHPVLVAWNEEAQKCVASLRPEDHVEMTVTSVEFVTALRHGYRLVKIHRFDKYTKTPSLWREKILDFYIEKMINSGPAPENVEEFIRRWDERFDIGDQIRKTIDDGRWGNFPARKQTAKIMINSAWGKHAQRPIMPEASIFNFTDDMEKVYNFFQNLTSRVYTFKDATVLDGDKVMYRYQKDGSTANPDLHGGYLPAALFVPAYGRMQLWEQLYKLGKRVLMCDTDSIVYVKDPTLYNIPQGDMLGEWEVEKIDSKNGGIRTFVGLGPKTYGLKTWNGPTQVKAKGLSLNLATSKAVNFDSMEAMVLEFLEKGSAPKISIPQQTFTYDIRRGMRTWKMLKDLQINKKDMKGFLDEHGHLYPFGFELNFSQ
jgi:hypothetical protein